MRIIQSPGEGPSHGKWSRELMMIQPAIATPTPTVTRFVTLLFRQLVLSAPMTRLVLYYSDSMCTFTHVLFETSYGRSKPSSFKRNLGIRISDDARQTCLFRLSERLTRMESLLKGLGSQTMYQFTLIFFSFEFSPRKPHSIMRRFTLLHACTYMLFFSTINAASPIAYANDFIDPDDILTKTLGDHTARSRESIIEWAKTLAAKGPWSE